MQTEDETAWHCTLGQSSWRELLLEEDAPETLLGQLLTRGDIVFEELLHPRKEWVVSPLSCIESCILLSRCGRVKKGLTVFSMVFVFIGKKANWWKNRRQ